MTTQQLNNKIKVLLAEDHLLARMGLEMILQRTTDMCVIGEAEDGEQAVECVHSQSPHVVLMDVSMPVMDGIEATELIRQQYPSTNVLMLTCDDGEKEIFASFAAGASGMVMKDAEPEQLLSAIRAVSTGEVWIDAVIAARLLKLRASFAAGRGSSMPPPYCAAIEALTKTDCLVLANIADGASCEVMAARFDVSPAVVKAYMRELVKKLAATKMLAAAGSMQLVGLT